MTKGIPASGKTDWTLKEMTRHPGRYKRVNRDSLREMIDRNMKSSDNEIFIKKMRDVLVEKILLQEYDIILDDMNFHDGNWTSICEVAKLIGDVRVVEKYFEVSLKEALIRNAERSKPLPTHIVEDIYKRHVKNKRVVVRDEYFPPVRQDFTIDPNKKMAAIVDIDGTLAMNYGGRSYFDLERVEEDTVNEHISSLIDYLALNGNLEILLVSGRAEVSRTKTESWLDHARPKPHFDKLFMRQTGDRRPDSIVKQEIYKELIEPFYNVMYVIDDRPVVCRMWRRLGLTVLQVNDKNV